VSYVDVNAGILWQHSGNRNYSIGYSLWHYGQPHGFLGVGDDKLYFRHVLHGHYKKQWKHIDMRFIGKTEIQSGALEASIGIEGKYRFGADSKYTDYRTSSALIAGLYYRNADNLTPVIGFDYKRLLTAWISYDVNVSPLNQATAFRGGWEIHLTHSGFLADKRRKLK
ncbi:MAG: type IX secretion system membrane protein PorP/SprF, partial [Flavobacteriales bacterium]|nr:type IX secretion system membrane protein PorP/SprF [Flavobacteriales bacterium]